MRTLVLLLLGWPLAAGAAESPPPLPWTLLAAEWDLGPQTPFESLSMDVRIDADLPATMHLQIAPLGSGFLAGSEFYGSMQTQVWARTVADHEHRWVGPGALFSLLGESAAEAIRPSERGLIELAPGYVGVRDGFAWKKGIHTFELVRMEQDEQSTWVGAYVRSRPGGARRFLGALRFPWGRPTLGHRLVSFVGIYGPEDPLHPRIPELTVTLGAPVVNGKRIAARATTRRDPDVPAFATAEVEDARVRIRLSNAGSAPPPCGKAGACGPERVCREGACMCGAGLIECAGACADPWRDAAHCGGCSPCGPHQACQEGRCACVAEDEAHMARCYDAM